VVGLSPTRLSAMPGTLEKTSAKHPEPPRFSLGELINTYVTTALHDEGGKPFRAEQQVEFTFRNKCT